MLTVIAYRGFPAMMIERATARLNLADGDFARMRVELSIVS
jgi:hypothetical protein